MRSDHLGIYGYARPTSPVIDDVAREGVVFRQVFAPSPWTLPSHGTLLTGKPPRQHGAYRDDLPLSSDVITLAEVLRGQGYRTAAFVSGPFLASVYGFSRGFDVYDESSVGDEKTVHRAETSSRLENLVSRWIGESLNRAPAEPFFVFLHLWDPHHDYVRRDATTAPFDPDYEGELSGEDIIRDPRFSVNMSPRDLEHVIALYDEEIRYTDRHIGNLLDFLRENEILDQTIVAITSDHGEEFFEHGERTHANNLYDESLRVPLIIRYPPRIPPGTVIERLVRLMDVGPTLLGLAAMPKPAGFGTGAASQHRERDLTQWVTGETSLESFPELLSFGHTTTKGWQASVRSESHKLIVRKNKQGGWFEVYDLDKDPLERNDLGMKGLSRRDFRRLRAEATAWNRLWKPESQRPTPLQLDAGQRKRLRVLGYVE